VIGAPEMYKVFLQQPRAGGLLDQHPELGKCRDGRPGDVRCCLQPRAGGLPNQHPESGKCRDGRPGHVRCLFYSQGLGGCLISTRRWGGTVVSDPDV